METALKEPPQNQSPRNNLPEAAPTGNSSQRSPEKISPIKRPPNLPPQTVLLGTSPEILPLKQP